MSQQFPVLLIGGLAMTARELEPLGKIILEREGCETFAFDNLCVGNGPRIKGGSDILTIEQQAEYQWKMVDEKFNGSPKRISIFGISMGGMIAATMATQRPNSVINLIVAATSPNTPDATAVPESLYAIWTKAKTASDIDTAVSIAFGQTTLKNNISIKNEYLKYRLSGLNKQTPLEFIQQVESIRHFDGRQIYKKLSQSKIHITVIAGEEDILFEKKHLESISKMIPNSSVYEIEKTGHMLHLENLNALSECILKGLGYAG